MDTTIESDSLSTNSAVPDPSAALPASESAQASAQDAPASAAPTPSAPAADSFVRDPHKLIAYIVPFPPPSPVIPGLPLRFVVYTPPPPPLLKPVEGHESASDKIQRKWQEEVRAAHSSSVPLFSWRGVKNAVTRGVHWAVGQTSSADLDFLTRIPRDGEVAAAHRHGGVDTSSDGDSSDDEHGPNGQGQDHEDTACRTVKLDSMILLYPPSMKMTEEELRVEFINSLMRTKSRAQRDAVIATGLLPVTAALDWALVFVGWVFGGALEVDAIWMANSFRGAKTARSVTRRLASSEDSITLSFLPSERASVLESYLLGKCVARNPRFDRPHWGIPTEEAVMTTIGWDAARAQDENWEDEAWQRDQVASDLRTTMTKAAKGWDKWVERYIKNPDKARTR